MRPEIEAELLHILRSSEEPSPESLEALLDRLSVGELREALKFVLGWASGYRRAIYDALGVMLKKERRKAE